MKSHKSYIDVGPFYKYSSPKKAEIIHIDGGFYLHIGIKHQINKLLTSSYCNDNKLIIDMNIDGIPLFKSSNSQLWPILIKVTNIPNLPVLAAGIYLGKSKLYNCDEFLSQFTCELKDLMENGIDIDEKYLEVQLRAIVCDAPDRAYVSGTPGHTPSHGCSKCTQVGKKINGVLTYKTESGDLITDEDFKNRKYSGHHSKHYLTKMSPFETLNVKMVTQIPLDCMHLIDLGVMRKFLNRLIYNKTCNKLMKEKKINISQKLIDLRKKMPREFVRKPRSLNELSNWKATEFRQFLLYTGISVLKNELSDDQYYEFKLLHCAYRMLCCPFHRMSNLGTIQRMLQLFVENFPIIFGENSVSYNVHSLLHIQQTVEQVGDPVHGSAYAFENYLQHIKNYVRKPTKILQQIHRRIDEEQFSPVLPSSDPVKINKYIIFKGSKLMQKEPNNYCYIEGDIPVVIVSVMEDSVEHFKARRFMNLRNFYTQPFNSCEIGIYLADAEPSPSEEIFKLSQLTCKAVVLPFLKDIIIMPLLHHIED